MTASCGDTIARECPAAKRHTLDHIGNRRGQKGKGKSALRSLIAASSNSSTKEHHLRLISCRFKNN